MKIHAFALIGFCSLTVLYSTRAGESPLLEKLDTDKNGSLAGDEIPEMFRERMDRVDTDGDGRLSAAELASLPERVIGRLLGASTGPGNVPRRPESAAMRPVRKPGEVVAPAAREEFDDSTLKSGDDAPDFSLRRQDDQAEITLSSFEGKKPVVLVFGSITCSPFRQKVAAVPAIFEKYQDRAEFLMVYIREAHPESVVEVPGGDDEKPLLKTFKQTDDFATRMENAQSCSQLIKMPFPTVVDGTDNRVKETYAGWPIRLMVVSIDGKIAYDGGLGPKGFEPEKLDEWLAKNL